MSNLDFLSIPFGKYIQNNLTLGSKLKNKPKIFSVNYFLRGKEGKFLNGKLDKHVWLKWMDLRVNGEVEARRSPTGFIPKYEDLKPLFQNILDQNFTEEQYEELFTIRIPELLAKTERIESVYRDKVKDTPEIVFKLLAEQKNQLKGAKQQYGEYIKPTQLEVVS